jgi:hypothetical protein
MKFLPANRLAQLETLLKPYMDCYGEKSAPDCLQHLLTEFERLRDNDNKRWCKRERWNSLWRSSWRVARALFFVVVSVLFIVLLIGQNLLVWRKLH